MPDPSSTSAALWHGETALVVAKPSGMLVHNSEYSGPKERSLRQEVGTALGRRVYPIHRVDRGTSGAVLFAKEQHFVQAWQRSLSDAGATKLYLCVIRGRVHAPREIATPLVDDRGVAQPAFTWVEPLGWCEAARCSLAAVAIATGRHHQIRRHLDQIGHPVVNDATHGDSRFNRASREHTGTTRLMLHAWMIRCRLPAAESRVETGRWLEVVAPPDGELAQALDAMFEDAPCGLHDSGVELGRRAGEWAESVRLPGGENTAEDPTGEP